jgi:hypothetical protein
MKDQWKLISRLNSFITGTEFNTCTSVHRSLRQTRYDIFLMFKKQNLVVEQRLVVIYYMYHIELCHVECHAYFAVNKKRVACFSSLVDVYLINQNVFNIARRHISF